MMASQDGKVTNLNDKLMEITYKDGTIQTFPVGDIYTQMEGTTYKNNLITQLKQGDSFKQGDNLYYHKDFFESDWLDQSKILFKMNRIVTAAITTTSETYEDSCAISNKLTNTLKTTIVKPRTFFLNFDNNVDNLISVGAEVDPNTTLFVDSGDGYNAGNLSETALSLLENLSAMSPRAKYKGKIDRITMKYNGDISDMTPSLAKLATKLDKEIRERTKGTDYEAKNNRVTGEYRSGNRRLELDTLELTFHIEIDLDASIGDKFVLGNQAKTVISDVYTYTQRGEQSLDEVEIMTSFVGFLQRVLDSPFRMGLVNRATRLVSKQLTDIYFKK